MERNHRPDRPSSRQALIRLVLACLGVIGVILVFRAPPMGGFDEPFHWRRALQLADLHPLATRLGPNDWGGRLDTRATDYEGRFDQAIADGAPISIPDMRALSDRLAHVPPSMRVVSFPSTASFSPLAYLPAATGIAIARALHLGLLSQMHAGRLASLAAYLLLVWCATTVLPVGRLAALAVLTVPAALHLASSFSADPVCNALPALLLACCLRLHLEPDHARPRFWKGGLLLLVLLLGLLKPIGFVLSGLVLLVPTALFASRRGAWAFRASAILGCLATTVLWNSAFPFVPGRYWHTGAEPGIAVRALLRSPGHGILVLLRNAWIDSRPWWVDGWGRFGGGPGPYHFTLPTGLAGLFLVALLALAVADRDTRAPRPGAALLLVLLAGLYTSALLLAFRIGYGPPLADFIEGVQGRYLLLPELLLLLAIALALPRWLQAGRLAAPFLLLCLTLDLAGATVALGRYAGVWN